MPKRKKTVQYNHEAVAFINAKEGEVIVDISKIGLFLREIRLKNNLTQLNAAEKLGITPQAVSKWERGESMPDITFLPEIAGMYGITVEEILSAGQAEMNLRSINMQRFSSGTIDSGLPLVHLFGDYGGRYRVGDAVLLPRAAAFDVDPLK